MRKKVEDIIGILFMMSVSLYPIRVSMQLKDLEKKLEQPKIIYQVDNAGAAMVGKITDKEITDGRYTVTAHAYGKFLVTEEQYESLHVGDEIPEYLKQRGMESNEVK